ncbi:MAG: cytochrome P450, partial [Cyanobacteria bacterium J06598_3]
FGNISDYSKDPMAFTRHCADKYGDVVPFSGLLFPGIQLNHPDDIEQVIVTQRDCFVKDQSLSILRLILGKGLLTSEGEFWQRQRRLMQPAFHRDRITAYSETMVNYTNRLLATWPSGEVRDIHQEMMGLTVEIAAQTLFGVNVTESAADIDKAMEAIIKYFGLRSTNPLLFFVPDWVPIPANLQFQRVARGMHDLIASFIAQRRSTNEEKGDLLSMLLQARDEAGQPMPDQQLQDEVMTLLVAGHETTANSLSWTLYLLAQYPEIEAKLLAELKTVLNGESPTVENYQQLSFTAQVIKESLRLYPPAWAIGRTVVKPCEIGGCQLKPGNFVFLSPWIVQSDPRFFEQPKTFMPERWTSEFEKQLPTFAYFPFSGGPRGCIGQAFAMMELVLVLATIMQQFEFELVPEQSVELWGAFTLRPRHGIKMVITKRASSHHH